MPGETTSNTDLIEREEDKLKEESDKKAEQSDANEETKSEQQANDSEENSAGSKQWPPLFDEVTDMLALSILSYGVADLRKLVRDGKIKGDADLVSKNQDEPISLVECINLFVLYMEDIKREMPKSFKVYMEAMSILVNKTLKVRSMEESKLLYVDDENADRGLVYMISVNALAKRITVTFRGSATVHDMLMDAKTSLVQIENPIAKYRISCPDTTTSGRGAPDIETLGIHRGFRDYLYGYSDTYPYPSLKKGEGRKLDKITSRVLATLDEYAGYSIAVTGHSLGGSLATLQAMELAAIDDDRINDPITCITFASPKVGNRAFANVFQYLERNHRVRCLRVANQFDIFPTIPKKGVRNCCGFTCGGDLIYRHVGVALLLKRDGDYMIRHYPRHYRHGVRLFFRDVGRGAAKRGETVGQWVGRENLAENHSCMEYWSRIHHCCDDLKNMDLHEQYKNVAGRHFESFGD